MSDPVRPEELDDVLSSIRRLVAKRPETDAGDPSDGDTGPQDAATAPDMTEPKPRDEDTGGPGHRADESDEPASFPENEFEMAPVELDVPTQSATLVLTPSLLVRDSAEGSLPDDLLDAVSGSASAPGKTAELPGIDEPGSETGAPPAASRDAEVDTPFSQESMVAVAEEPADDEVSVTPPIPSSDGLSEGPGAPDGTSETQVDGIGAMPTAAGNEREFEQKLAELEEILGISQTDDDASAKNDEAVPAATLESQPTDDAIHQMARDAVREALRDEEALRLLDPENLRALIKAEVKRAIALVLRQSAGNGLFSLSPSQGEQDVGVHVAEKDEPEQPDGSDTTERDTRSPTVPPQNTEDTAPPTPRSDDQGSQRAALGAVPNDLR